MYGSPGESVGLKFIPIESESFQAIPESVSESLRTNPKNGLYLVWWKTPKNQPNLFWFNSRH